MGAASSFVPAKIHRFRRAKSLQLTEGQASRLARLRARGRQLVGSVLSHLHVPGAIADAEIDDEVSGHRIEVKTEGLFTRIRVNGRDFYFDRITGRFDGTGSGCV